MFRVRLPERHHDVHPTSADALQPPAMCLGRDVFRNTVLGRPAKYFDQAMIGHRPVSTEVLWTGSVGQLFRYPVKSMQGETVEQLTIGSGGVEGDRSLALLDRESGNVVSAHHPQKWGLLLHCSARWKGEPNRGGEIVVTLPDGSEERAGPHLEAVLSELLGRRVGLIREAPDGGSYEYLHPDIE